MLLTTAQAEGAADTALRIHFGWSLEELRSHGRLGGWQAAVRTALMRVLSANSMLNRGEIAALVGVRPGSVRWAVDHADSTPPAKQERVLLCEKLLYKSMIGGSERGDVMPQA